MRFFPLVLVLTACSFAPIVPVKAEEPAPAKNVAIPQQPAPLPAPAAEVPQKPAAEVRQPAPALAPAPAAPTKPPIVCYVSTTTKWVNDKNGLSAKPECVKGYAQDFMRTPADGPDGSRIIFTGICCQKPVPK